MRHFIFLIFSCLYLFSSENLLLAQKGISGFVKDKITGEILPVATVLETGTNNAVCTDNNGYFRIIPTSENPIRISYVGYKNFSLPSFSYDTLLTVYLEPGTDIQEVEFVAPRLQRSNVVSLTKTEMINIPALGAKPDLLKSVQLLPGIKSQTEGTSMLIVRGGNPGENQYLFDNVPVIYVNHLGGFMSVFNPEMINKVDVYKGGFPARFGGKLSSIVDITQREGHPLECRGTAEIGITDASFSVEGPVKSEKLRYIVTGRKTLIDPLFILASSLSQIGGYILSYGFHDVNAKLSWNPNPRNNLHLNLYQGDDYLQYWMKKKEGKETEKGSMGNIWGNWLISLRWNKSFSPRLYLNQSLSYTRYRLRNDQRYSIQSSRDTAEFNREYKSSLQSINYQSGFNCTFNSFWTVQWGLQSTLWMHLPNYTRTNAVEENSPFTRTKSVESALFAENRIRFFKSSEAIIGYRLVNYLTRGMSEFSWEPRVQVNFGISQSQFLNVSYMKVSQYSHLLFTPGSIMSGEVWIPAGKDIEGSWTNQFSIGWRGDFYNGMLKAELDVYQKELYGLSTYREGFKSLQGDADWRSKVETGGKGSSVGIEFLLRKASGRWTGFASYSYSRSTRIYPNINRGEEYPYEYDRPHSGSLHISYKLKENLSFSLSWVGQSGLPYTPVIGRQYAPSLEPYYMGDFQYYEALIYGERNSERMKLYHRMDLGLRYSTFSKRTGRKTEWNFSLYNAYNRRNPNFYYYNHNNTGEIYEPETGIDFKPLSLYQISLFPILPTVSYKVYFGKSFNSGIKRKSIKQRFNQWLYMEK